MRKVEFVSVPESFGRDAGKVFKITEKSAVEAEKWAWRLFFVLKGTTAQIPESIATLGMIAVFVRGINSILAADVDWERLEPLLDELLECVQIERDRAARTSLGERIASALIPDDVEEVRTVAWLRSEVLRIHANFSFTEALLSWLATANSTISGTTSPST